MLERKKKHIENGERNILPEKLTSDEVERLRKSNRKMD
jgi:hypothetical protein